MILTGRKLKQLRDLETGISLVSNLLNMFIDNYDNESFKEYFPLYLHFKRDFKNLTCINFIDMGVEFYATYLGLMS